MYCGSIPSILGQGLTLVQAKTLLTEVTTSARVLLKNIWGKKSFPMTDPKCLFKLHKKGNLQNVLTEGGVSLITQWKEPASTSGWG